MLDQLKEDPATAAIPVIVLSADATTSQIERLRTAGAAQYMTKPIDIEALLDVIRANTEGIEADDLPR